MKGTCRDSINLKFCLVLTFPVIFSPLLFLDENNEKVFKCLYVAALINGYSLLRAFPMEISFLLPVVLLPILGIFDTGAVTKFYMTEISMMMLSMFIIGLAMELSNLQNRATYKLLIQTGSTPAKIIFAVIIACGFIANVLSIITIVTIVFPTALSIVEEMNKATMLAVAEEPSLSDMSANTDPLQLDKSVNENNEENLVEHVIIENTEKSTSAIPNTIVGNNLNFKKSLFIGILYASIIGSKLSIYGNRASLLFTQLLQSKGTFDRSELNFMTWLIFNLPIVIILLIFLWCILTSGCLWTSSPKSDHGSETSGVGVKISDRKRNETMSAMVKKGYRDLGSISFREIVVALFLLCAFLLWFTRDPTFFNGWRHWFPSVKVGDATPTVLLSVLFLTLPTKWPRNKECYDTFVTWKLVQNRMPWGALIITGGGIALSEGIVKSGLTIRIGENLSFLEDLPKEAILIILLLIESVATEFVSGSTILLIIFPILDSMSWRMNIHPLYFGLPTAITCGFGFVLPTASPYVALMFSLSDGDLRITDTLKFGILTNFIAIIVLFLANITWGEYIFNYSEYSNSSNSSISTFSP